MKKISLIFSFIFLLTSCGYSSSIVHVRSQQKCRKFSKGTGFFITEDGFIMTAYHIIDNRKSDNHIFVRLKTKKGIKDFKAEIIMKNIPKDRVILKIKVKDQKPLHFCKKVILGNKVAIYKRFDDWTLEKSIGFVSKEENNRVYTTAKTRKGFSGSPIRDINNNCVLGVLYGRGSGYTSLIE